MRRRAKRAISPSPYTALMERLRRVRHAIRELRENSPGATGNDSVGAAHGPDQLRIVGETMSEIDREILPHIRDRADPIAFILPSAHEWVGWESTRIVDTDEEFHEHMLDLIHAGLEQSLVMHLGMLGPHLRQQSDGIDCSMVPLLMGFGLQRLEQSLEREDMTAACRFAGIIFNALHFNPDFSLARDRIRQRGPYDFDNYRIWFSSCLDDIRRKYPSLDAVSLLRHAIALFPSLLGAPGDPLPLALQFADKSRDYMNQSGQDLLELLAQYIEQCEPGAKDVPTVWNFVSGDGHRVVRDFMRCRNHRIPPFQLELLTRVRDNLVSGTLLADAGSVRP